MLNACQAYGKQRGTKDKVTGRMARAEKQIHNGVQVYLASSVWFNVHIGF
jgi:hypothetical protein